MSAARVLAGLLIAGGVLWLGLRLAAPSAVAASAIQPRETLRVGMWTL